MALSVDAIRAGFATLPRELYDVIEDFVFTAPAGPINLSDRFNPIVDTSFKLLQLSRATRAKYAASYYSREFCFGAGWFMNCTSPAIDWVLSISPTHRNFLTKITLMRLTNKNLSTNDFLGGIIQSCKLDMSMNLGPVIANKVVYQLTDNR